MKRNIGHFWHTWVEHPNGNEYLLFGEEIASSQRTAGNNYQADAVRNQFTGYQKDEETADDFAQARYYSSKLGRFNSVDPEGIGADENDPQSWNGYGYARNNPILFTIQRVKNGRFVIIKELALKFQMRMLQILSLTETEIIQK